MPRHRTSARVPRLGSDGYSLVEVVVAMLITVVMVTAVMGVAVTSKQGGSQGMHRMMFNQGIAQLSAEVKQYVTACGCVKSTGFCPSPGCDDPAINGPNTMNAGVAQWYLNGAPGGNGTLVDSQGPVWALSCGAHTITHLFPPLPSPAALEAAPYSGSITYTVSWPGCNAGCVCAPDLPSATDAPTITFAANWTEP